MKAMALALQTTTRVIWKHLRNGKPLGGGIIERQTMPEFMTGEQWRAIVMRGDRIFVSNYGRVAKKGAILVPS